MNENFLPEDISFNALRPQAAVYLLNLQVVCRYPQAIRLASGIETFLYADLRNLGLSFEKNPPVLKLLELGVLKVIEQKQAEGINITAIGGAAMGGFVWSSQLIANENFLNYHHFVYSKNDQGETDVSIGGRPRAGGIDSILIEDVLTTGESSLFAVHQLSQRGIYVRGIVPIIQRDDIVDIDFIGDSRIPIYPLFKMTEFEL